MLNIKQKISDECRYISGIFKDGIQKTLDSLSYSILGFGEIRTYLHSREASMIAERYLFDNHRLISQETSNKLSEFSNYRTVGNVTVLGLGFAKTISYGVLVVSKSPIPLLVILGIGLAEEKILDDVYKNVISSSKSD